MNVAKNLSRFLSLFLSLILTLPSSAFALRQVGLEESSAKEDFLARLGVPSVTAPPTATSGLEEKQRVDAVQGFLDAFLTELRKRQASPQPGDPPLPQLLLELAAVQYVKTPALQESDITLEALFSMILGTPSFPAKILKSQINLLLATDDLFRISGRDLLYVPTDQILDRTFPPSSSLGQRIPREGLSQLIQRAKGVVSTPLDTGDDAVDELIANLRVNTLTKESDGELMGNLKEDNPEKPKSVRERMIDHLGIRIPKLRSYTVARRGSVYPYLITPVRPEPRDDGSRPSGMQYKIGIPPLLKDMPADLEAQRARGKNPYVYQDISLPSDDPLYPVVWKLLLDKEPDRVMQLIANLEVVQPGTVRLGSTSEAEIVYTVPRLEGPPSYSIEEEKRGDGKGYRGGIRYVVQLSSGQSALSRNSYFNVYWDDPLGEQIKSLLKAATAGLEERAYAVNAARDYLEEQARAFRVGWDGATEPAGRANQIFFTWGAGQEIVDFERDNSPETRIGDYVVTVAARSSPAGQEVLIAREGNRFIVRPVSADYRSEPPVTMPLGPSGLPWKTGLEESSTAVLERPVVVVSAATKALLKEAGWQLGGLQLSSAGGVHAGHIFLNGATVATLFLLHVPSELGLSPNVAVVSPLERDMLRTIAQGAGFPESQIDEWDAAYLVRYDPDVSGDIKRATEQARTIVGQRLSGVAQPQIKLVLTLPALDEFGRWLRTILESFGITLQSGELNDRQIDAFYQAAQA